MSGIDLKVLADSLHVTALVFMMTVAGDAVNLFTCGRLRAAPAGQGCNQYAVSSLLSAMPGGLGMFTTG